LGGVAGLVAAAQQLQARGDTRQTEELRLNPHVSGYVLTQLSDAAWELSAGITSLWREPEPPLLAMARVNASRLLILRPEGAAAVAGGMLLVHSWLVDEHGSTESARLWLELLDESGAVLWTQGTDVQTVGKVSNLGAISAPMPAVPGSYRLRAVLEVPTQYVETAQPLLVLAPTAPVTGRGIAALGAEVQARMPDAWPKVGQDLPLLAQAAALSSRDLPHIVEWVRAGHHLALLDLDPYEAPRVAYAFGLELSSVGTRGSYLGYFHFLRPHALFARCARFPAQRSPRAS
jgi:hypothetical protein